jgi:hypothetical protein
LTIVHKLAFETVRHAAGFLQGRRDRFYSSEECGLTSIAVQNNPGRLALQGAGRGGVTVAPKPTYEADPSDWFAGAGA